MSPGVHLVSKHAVVKLIHILLSAAGVVQVWPAAPPEVSVAALASAPISYQVQFEGDLYSFIHLFVQQVKMLLARKISSFYTWTLK